MFEKLLRDLRRLEQTGVSVPLQADEEGYIDRECPAEECLFQFKVFEEDWEKKVRDERVFCPMCRHAANSNSWLTKEQLEQAKAQATKYIHGLTTKALKEGVQRFNRQQSRNSFIRLNVSVKGPSPHYILPIPAQFEIERKIKCAQCHARYAVVGSAFFCPCCGYNSVEETFDNSIEAIKATINHLPVIRASVETINKDEAANTCRSLIEKGLLDCVVAFQRYCEMVYRKHPQAQSKIPFNAFQKLDIGSQLWIKVIGEGYSNWLSPKEYERLNILFQRRHLLQHTEGIVDQKYLEKTSDRTYTRNQRIVVREKDVLELATYVNNLVHNIRAKL